KRPASIEPLMNMSLFWAVLMIPDKTVTHSGLVLVVAGINVRSEVWKVTLDEGVPPAWLFRTASGSARLSASIATINLVFFVLILCSFRLEPVVVRRPR